MAFFGFGIGKEFAEPTNRSANAAEAVDGSDCVAAAKLGTVYFCHNQIIVVQPGATGHEVIAIFSTTAAAIEDCCASVDDRLAQLAGGNTFLRLARDSVFQALRQQCGIIIRHGSIVAGGSDGSTSS